jgi:uncharacterized membrane protein YdjX (TVP38/TMEM64 family)
MGRGHRSHLGRSGVTDPAERGDGLGIVYGTVLGGLLGSVGLITGGLLGYILMLTSARRMAKRFVGPQSLSTMESLFERAGAWAIVLTRSLPTAFRRP